MCATFSPPERFFAAAAILLPHPEGKANHAALARRRGGMRHGPLRARAGASILCDMANLIDTRAGRQEGPRHPEKAHRPDTPMLRKPDW
ncbi:MAG: hypothetical protein AB7M12_13570, partial [Hyphomonadaceae bacterium]